MTAGEAEDERTVRRRPHARDLMLLIALALLGGLIALWVGRKTIATDRIDQVLAAARVPARYTIADLGLERQRLVNVVLGDPARPDLVADWIELRTRIGLDGASVTAVSAGRVRLRGRLIDGKVSLGSLDRLLPASDGKPFALPAIDLDVRDARMRLETPYGLVGLKLAGSGRLDGGFTGTLAAVSRRLGVGDCAATEAGAVMRVSVSGKQPGVTGPVRAERVSCGGVRVARLGSDVAVSLSETLDRWDGEAKAVAAVVSHSLGRAEAARASFTFTGTAQETKGRFAIDSGRFASRVARGAAAHYAGAYRTGPTTELVATLSGEGVALAPAQIAAIARAAQAGAGTPVGPLAAQLVRAAVAAGRSARLQARSTLRLAGGRGDLEVQRVVVRSASGVNAALDDAAVSYGWPGGALRLSGRLAMSGGGMPALDATLAQAAVGAPVIGVATLRQPYRAGGAEVMLAPVRFAATPGGNTRIATTVRLSGPIRGGRVERLSFPVAALWNGRDRFVANPDCTRASFDRLMLSGLDLRPAALSLCPTGRAMVEVARARVTGGATIAAPRLAGTLGGSAVTLAAGRAEVALAAPGFTLEDVAVRLGTGDSVTRLDLASLHGAIGDGGVVGGFSGGAGQIGKVPLLMSAAAGDWRFDRALRVTGALTIADDYLDPRFRPLLARGVSLVLAGNRITAEGALVQPAKSVEVAKVNIVHDLARSTGQADLAVPGIAFGERFQPDELTRLTFGVIANVKGSVRGEGRIRWNGEGVTSNGVFRTAGTDLAAAFGPVTGISTEIRFTDLLGLQSAPGQVATIRSLNPGIPVENGTIRYQTLPEARVAVEDGRWPFAGGSLVLEPTLLDFSEAKQRRMTFRVTKVEAAQFLQQFDFDNLNATGIFDGSLPMVFDQTGGRIEQGRLVVRPGGGTIAYIGEVSREDVGIWGNLAFGALKSLRYRDLDIVMNGPLAGEMVTEVRFAGVNQGEGAKRNFLFDRLQRLPFIFNVRIAAPFRQLIDSTQSFYDPKRLVERNLPTLIEERDRQGTPPVQPQESRTVP